MQAVVKRDDEDSHIFLVLFKHDDHNKIEFRPAWVTLPEILAANEDLYHQFNIECATANFQRQLGY